MTLLKQLWCDERGVAMAEYALLLSIVAVGTIAALQQFRDVIITTFERAAAEIAATH